jgi:hypothetical protein
MTVARIFYRAALAGVAAVALAAPGVALADVQPPPDGTPPSQFATADTGCLGQLRSMIASGQLAGVVLPDGLVIPSGFDGAFNPGGHYGTVLEAQFLEHGITDLNAFCAQFAADERMSGRSGHHQLRAPGP